MALAFGRIHVFSVLVLQMEEHSFFPEQINIRTAGICLLQFADNARRTCILRGLLEKALRRSDFSVTLVIKVLCKR